MDQWLPNLFESSGLHQHRSINCSFLSNLVPLKMILDIMVIGALNFSDLDMLPSALFQHGGPSGKEHRFIDL